MKIVDFFINVNYKINRYKLQFLALLSIWLGALLVFWTTHAYEDPWDLFMISLGIRNPSPTSDFSNFFALVWPILLEVVVFGFVLGELFERYNPEIASKVRAHHQRNHTVIIGYHHLAERLVEHCIEHGKSFVVIEDEAELVEDVVGAGYPVVIGDPGEEANLQFVRIERAKEVFICIDEVHIAMICTTNIRRYNKNCPIYARIFEDHVQNYLESEYNNVLTFSTSKWAMEIITEWTKTAKDKVVVIGRDHLTHRIGRYLSLKEELQVYLFDDIHDGFLFKENPRIHIIHHFACFLSDLKQYVNLDEVSQVYFCWKRDSEFDEMIYLVSKLRTRYPHIEIFCRAFNTETLPLIERYKARTFSASSIAFKTLQHHVPKDSAIYEDPNKHKKGDDMYHM